MKRLGRTTFLKDDPEIIRQYDEYHAHAWPEVVEGIKHLLGVRKMLIYRWGRQLFMYMEVEDDYDPARNWPRYVANPRVAEWQDMMAGFQDPPEGTTPEDTWLDMKEVFVLEAD